jgi:hypothetical protein
MCDPSDAPWYSQTSRAVQYRFDVAAQVMAAGAQDIHVTVLTPFVRPG